MIKERIILTEEVVDVLQVGLDGKANVTGDDGHVLITVKPEDFEQHLGFLLRQVSQMVDQSFPNRREDIHLLFRNEDGSCQQQFRLWHPIEKAG
jgi:hypothetical protein